MEYLLILLGMIFAYPVFMVVVFVLSKVLFPKQDEFTEFDAKQRERIKERRGQTLPSREQTLAHA
jgi:hypothetical protein